MIRATEEANTCQVMPLCDVLGAILVVRFFIPVLSRNMI